MPATYSTDLRSAMKEIRDICKKYDIGGVIALADKEHGEFAFQIPTWSLAQWEDETSGKLRLRAKTGVHPKEQFESTLHFLLSTKDICAGYVQQMSAMEGMVREHGIGLEHRNQWGEHNNDDRLPE